MATPTTEHISNAPYPAADGNLCVPAAVAAQAMRRPNAIAVAAGAAVMTYAELDSQARRLARRLRSMGVGADTLVGLCLPRSPEMVMAALGILKAGGAYVPMDPAYPADRLAFMLEDAGTPVLVTSSCLARMFPNPRIQMVILDSAEMKGEPDPLAAIDIAGIDIRPTDLAYAIYTSGSTGKPKGVEITHAGLSNLVSWHCAAFGVTPEDRASHVAGLSFDAAVWEIWPYLASGASLQMADDATRGSPELLRDWLIEHGITISFVPTPIAERMLSLQWPERTPLRILLTGGDTLRRYPSPSLPFRLVNNYGPTECTVVATSGDVLPGPNPEALPSIGCAIANTRIYLLDEQGQPVSPPSLGEIYIGGAGVARGYRHQPGLTAAKFLPDPFHEEPG
ncbi:MAG TPA: AMP-binding protein, partial [Bryobacteraceae bacterium]|nr:AMP-binding protein [Bryobacteraceae bacterium]